MTLPLKTRILIFFASNPDEQMTTTEMMRKFNVPRQTVLNELASLEESGIVSMERKTGSSGSVPLLWSSGPSLLEEL